MTVDKLTTSSDAGWLSANNTINSNSYANSYANNSNMLSGIDQNSSTNNYGPSGDSDETMCPDVGVFSVEQPRLGGHHGDPAARADRGRHARQDGAARPWLQLSLPNTIKLTTVDMYSRHDQDRTIEGYFYGSNDETTWYELVEISSASDNLSGYEYLY